MKKSKISVLCYIVFALSLGSILISCERSKDDPKGLYENGIFITNEGTYGSNNGSISYYSYGGDTVSNKIFQSTNNRVLGDVVQSITENGDNAFIVVNNSNKVEIVNRYTFKELGVIEDIILPRYIVAKGSKAYVSCWDNTIKVIDISGLSVTKSIDVGTGPERMLIINDKMYVANGGAYSTDSTISVIDLSTEQVVAKIIVKYNPKSLVLDKSGKIWALCAGKTVYEGQTLVEESPSMLYKIDAATNNVEAELKLFENAHPKILQINKDGTTLYHDGGFKAAGIYSLVIEGNQATQTKFIDKVAYGFNYDSKSDVLFVCDAGNYVSNGKLFRYSTSGTLLKEYEVGVVPNGTSFKKAK